MRKHIAILLFTAALPLLSACGGNLVTALDEERFYDVKIYGENKDVKETGFIGPSACCAFARSCATIPANDMGGAACTKQGGDFMNTRQCVQGTCQ